MRSIRFLRMALAAVVAAICATCSSVGPYDIPVTDLPVIALTLPGDGYSQLIKGTYLNDWVAAVAMVGGQRYEGRMRISGQITRHDPKKSYKLVLTRGFDPLSVQHAYVFSAQFRDESFVRHRLATHLFTKAGLRCSRVRPVELFIDGEPHGLYLECEPVDSAFFITRNLPISSLYEVNCRARLDQADLMLAEQAFEKQLPDDDHCYADLTELLRVVTHGITEDNLRVLGRILDVENALNYYAAVLLTDNADGVRNNYYLYLNPLTARFELIPWDLDQTFKSPSGTLSTYENGLFEQLMAIPSCRAYVVRRLHELFCLEEALALVDSFATEVRPCYNRDPYLTVAGMNQDSAVAHVREYLRGFAALLQDL
ncbi:MAG: hypothetical protein GF331_22765 [Chitinivibrionales bacterium]|nr:hypothetical protein [Chitinivibrionales bacterium]